MFPKGDPRLVTRATISISKGVAWKSRRRPAVCSTGSGRGPLCPELPFESNRSCLGNRHWGIGTGEPALKVRLHTPFHLETLLQQQDAR